MPFRPSAVLASLLVGTAALAGGATSARAQEVNVDSLRAMYMIALPPTLHLMSTAPRTSPGSSAGSPTAYGPNWGDGFAGMGFVARARGTRNGSLRDDMDGTVGAGFGLGNSRDLIGLEVAITSFSTWDYGFFNRMGLNMKVHRVLPGNFGLAVGMENVATRGFVDVPDRTMYGVISRVWPQDWWNPFNTVTASIGAGNGRFQREADVAAGRNNLNVFGSVGVQFWEPIAAVADWTGQDLALGLSIVPFRRIPIIITPAFVDVTGAAGDGARFTLGAGTGFQFARLRDIVF